MAKVKEMSFSKSLKLNKNYNSSGVDFSITISLEDGDDVADVKERGWATVDDQITAQVREIIEVLDTMGE